MTAQPTTQDLHNQERPRVFKGFSENEAERAWRALVEAARGFRAPPEAEAKEVAKDG